MFYKKDEAKEAARSYFHGIWAAFHTPMTADGEIDEAGIRVNVIRLVDEWGLAGIMCNGAVGEFWALTIEEQRRVIEVTADAARGRCGVIAMTSSTSARECIALTRFAEDVGVEFAAPFTPYFPKATEKGIADWFKEVADSVDIGLWVIDTGLAGPHLSLDLTAELAKIPNVVGLKVQRGTDHFRAVQRVTGGSLVISDPHEASLLERVREGQQVYMSSPAPVLMQRPGYTPIVDYFDAAEKGDWVQAEQISASLEPLRRLYERYLSKEMFQGTIAVPLIKAWSARLGLAAGPTRPPMVELSVHERETLHRELESLESGLVQD